MTRVPKTRTRLQDQPRSVEFQASPGPRRLAAWMCAVIAVMLVIHQTQIEGSGIALRALTLFGMVLFVGLAWFFFKRAARRGTVMQVGPEGFGMAIGFDSWVEYPWSKIQAFRYYEPTGFMLLVKRRQTRWLGVVPLQPPNTAEMPWDARFEIWLNTVHNRPAFCLMEPFVDAPILDVLQAFKDLAPEDLDDYEWLAPRKHTQ